MAVIGAVTMVRNEEDIIELSIRHMLDEGVDFVLVADHRSTDNTRAILQSLTETGRVQWQPNFDLYFQAPIWMNLLAAQAHAQGAEWIIPFDADEFWQSCTGETIADVVAKVPSDVNKLRAILWHHLDIDHRCPEPQVPQFGKVAYRWEPEAVVCWGNHDVRLTSPSELTDVLMVRHLPWRSPAQMMRKIRETSQAFDFQARREGQGGHITCHEYKTDAEMQDLWDGIMRHPRVCDPIPFR